MEPELTAVRAPIQLQIADAIRVKIEKGEYQPGDALPPTHDLAAEWGCSVTSVRAAYQLLKGQGLISGGRGRAPTVRVPPRRVVLTSDRHQIEKDRARAPETERRDHGEAEDVLGLPLGDVDFRADYLFVPAGDELAEVFGCEPGEELLRKQYESRDRSGWTRYSFSVSYVPVRLLESRPELLRSECEPWPGGHQHQLSLVGIEVAEIVDEVKARMPTTAEAQRWALDDGIPLLCVRRISVDTGGNVVEVSDAQYPADRTELRFSTPLKPWSE
jgi:GntR family transcriptional regulator